VNKLAESEKIDYYTTISIKFLASFLISVFLGYGFADGRSIATKIKGKTLHYNNTLNFNDENSEQVYIIGSNTTYYFYVTKGEQTVKIAPIASIKNIELTENKMLNN